MCIVLDNDEPKKLHVIIKPPTIQANHTGPTGDELRAQAKSLMLGNLGYSYTGGKRATTKMQDMMKRSTSVSSNMLDNKPKLFDPFPPPSTSSDSSSSPLSSQSIPPQKTGGSLASNPWDSNPDFTLNQGSSYQNPFPITLGAPPAPSRNLPNITNNISNNYGNNIINNFPKYPVSSVSSVVPIPLAVAFVEKVSAVFVGADEGRCRTRIEGDMILTFPSGVLQSLLANPNHPALSFCLTQTSMLENILPNKHLLTQETQIDDGRITYTFNMANLTNQLKKQAEAKAIPQPYQNIPVIKYQVSCQIILQNGKALVRSTYVMNRIMYLMRRISCELWLFALYRLNQTCYDDRVP